MNREYVKWWSPSLGRDMEMLVYGHSGTPVLVFPSSMGRFFEWEDFHMIGTCQYQLNSGQNQFFCVDSVDAESFYNKGVDPHTRFMRYRQYEAYIMNEVLPFIRNKNHTPYLISTGASFGAYHAANIVLKHPQKFNKLIAISGKYDIRSFADGHHEDNIYYNNPIEFMYHVGGDQLEAIKRLDLRFVVGDADICFQANHDFCHVLYQKGIWYELDVWSPNVVHDWHEWRRMILKHLP